MINLEMWGFEPAAGFGVPTTGTVEGDPVAEGTGGVPKDLTFGAHLAESLVGVVDEDVDEEAVPDVPVTFVLTPPMREPIARMLEMPAPFGQAGSSEEGDRVENAPPAEGTIDGTGEVPAEAATSIEIEPALEVPAEPGTSVAIRPQPEVLVEGGTSVDPRIPVDTRISIEVEPPSEPRTEEARDTGMRTQVWATETPGPREQNIAAPAGQVDAPSAPGKAPAERTATGVEPRSEGERPLEPRAIERHDGPAEITPKRAPERNAVKAADSPTPHMEPVSNRDVVPVRRSEPSIPANDVPQAPPMEGRDAPSADEQEFGARQERERPELRVQQATVEPRVEFARAAAESQAPQAPPSTPAAHVITEAAPRVVLHSAPVPFEPMVGGSDNVPAPPETRGPLPRETSESIVQSLRLQYQRGGGDAIVHIKPEHLGPVSVSLRVENGSVSAVVNAENPAVAEWLKANEHLLREGLASNGLHLERFAIKRDGHPPDGDRKGWRSPDERGRRRRALEPESTFEITV